MENEKLNKWIEENKEMVDLLLIDYQKFQRKFNKDYQFFYFLEKQK